MNRATQTDSNTAVSKEAYAYTPGLKVKRAMTISKTRRLPAPGDVLVEVGDRVNYGTIVARTRISSDPVIVKAASLLGVEPEDLSRHMIKKEGDLILKDEPLAAYSALFGVIKKQALSPIEGSIETISDLTGQVIVRGSPIPVELDAYISGKVVKTLPKEGVVIETNAALIQGIFGIGGEAHGKITLRVNSPEDVISKEMVSPNDKGSVLVGGSLVTLEALRKSVEVGVSCIVTGGVLHEDLVTFLGEEIGAVMSGEEEVALTLIVTEGFGKMRMSQRTFNLLKHFEGCMASANGTTQIRAGVQRPEIIVPHEENVEQSPLDNLAEGMLLGTLIRIIKRPHFGAIGKIVSLPVGLQDFKSECSARIVNVELEDGKIVAVARANVEIIEE